MDSRAGWGCVFLALLLLTVPVSLLAAAALAAVCHELCHVLAVILLGGRVERFSLTLGGAVLDISGLSCGREALASAAGPAGSLLLLLGLRRFPVLALCGLAQGCFNLLPVYPLDGGRLLARILECLGKQEKAASVLSVTTWASLGILSAVCLWLRMPLAIAFLIPLIPKKISLQTGHRQSTIGLPRIKR